MTKIEVYSDGSGNTFDSDGGYGWRLVIDGALHSEGSGYLASATNNVAELTGAISGLQAVHNYLTAGGIQPTDADITLVADSQLVLGYASGRYACKALHLAPLFIQLKASYQALQAKGRWVKGHAGDEHNEGCDKLAKAARNSKGISATKES